MDNSGIYNLILSLIKSFGNKNASQNSQNGQNSSDLEKASLGENQEDNALNKNLEDTANTNADYLPLQSDMINTMKNHDEFIRRVKRNNPENTL